LWLRAFSGTASIWAKRASTDELVPRVSAAHSSPITSGEASVTAAWSGTFASYASVEVTGASSTTRSSSSVVLVPCTRRAHGTNPASEPGRLIRFAVDDSQRAGPALIAGVDQRSLSGIADDAIPAPA